MVLKDVDEVKLDFLPSLADLDGHGTRDYIPRGKILGVRCISFHKSLTLAVDEISTLSAHTLSNQTTGTIDSCKNDVVTRCFKKSTETKTACGKRCEIRVKCQKQTTSSAHRCDMYGRCPKPCSHNLCSCTKWKLEKGSDNLSIIER